MIDLSFQGTGAAEPSVEANRLLSRAHHSRQHWSVDARDGVEGSLLRSLLLVPDCHCQLIQRCDESLPFPAASVVIVASHDYSLSHPIARIHHHSHCYGIGFSWEHHRPAVGRHSNHSIDLICPTQTVAHEPLEARVQPSFETANDAGTPGTSVVPPLRHDDGALPLVASVPIALCALPHPSTTQSVLTFESHPSFLHYFELAVSCTLGICSSCAVAKRPTRMLQIVSHRRTHRLVDVSCMLHGKTPKPFLPHRNIFQWERNC
mmetsp:Transcript_50295/g.75124  ORF Transcript_50295/g.75124 Transcript_50295/m.75124 type:complete len:263 (-) Transcript_50295:259-1047(-)